MKSLNRETREILAKRRIDLLLQEAIIAKQLERLIITSLVENLVAKANLILHHA
jgi:hypothetical protein